MSKPTIVVTLLAVLAVATSSEGAITDWDREVLGLRNNNGYQKINYTPTDGTLGDYYVVDSGALRYDIPGTDDDFKNWYVPGVNSNPNAHMSGIEGGYLKSGVNFPTVAHTDGLYNQPEITGAESDDFWLAYYEDSGVFNGDDMVVSDIILTVETPDYVVDHPTESGAVTDHVSNTISDLTQNQGSWLFDVVTTDAMLDKLKNYWMQFSATGHGNSLDTWCIEKTSLTALTSIFASDQSIGNYWVSNIASMDFFGGVRKITLLKFKARTGPVVKFSYTNGRPVDADLFGNSAYSPVYYRVEDAFLN